MTGDLAFKDFSFSYSPHDPLAIDGVTLDVPPCSVTAVVGPSGAGKTTLLSAAAGLLRHYPTGRASGTIGLDGRSYSPFPPRVNFPRVAMLLQDASLTFSGMATTVRGEIELGLHNAGFPPSDIPSRAGEAARPSGTASLLDRNPSSLSGGETKKAALACILAPRPAILLLDEPAASLDTEAISVLARSLRSFATDTTILFTDTGPELAIRCADRISVLDHGALLFVGTTTEFLRSLRSWRDILPVESWIDATRALDESRGSSIARRLSRCAWVR